MKSLKDGFLVNTSQGVNLNSNGHRCKELESLNLRNYILFVGDNVCLSYHIPIEETFPYLISQELKTDYYNLAVFNGGIDGVKFNLFTWLFKVKQPPRAIIMACQFANAIIVSNPNMNILGPANYDDSDVQTLMSTGDLTGFHNGRRTIVSNLVNQLNIPIYQIVFPNKEKIVESTNVIHLDYTGDIFNQKGIADLVVKTMQVKSSRIRP